MQKEAFTFLSGQGETKIHAVRWQEETLKPRGILQLVHGMVEYIDRYDTFARYMAKKGWLVVGHDHLGHGKSVKNTADLGFFAEEKGDRYVLKDIKTVADKMKKEHPALPHFILAHSMGSFFVRRYLHTFPQDTFNGVILTGTGCIEKRKMLLALKVAKIETEIWGPRYRSPLINRGGILAYERYFLEERQKNAWLSRDKKNVERYNQDTLTDFVFTCGAYFDLFKTMAGLYNPKNIAKMRRDIPIFLLSGGSDPVGDMGEGVARLYEQYILAGIPVQLKIHPYDRHEVLNELDKDQVYAEIESFMEKNSQK